MTEETFTCDTCGDVFQSSISAALCEARDEDEAKAARRGPKPPRPSSFIRAYD